MTVQTQVSSGEEPDSNSDEETGSIERLRNREHNSQVTFQSLPVSIDEPISQDSSSVPAWHASQGVSSKKELFHPSRHQQQSGNASAELSTGRSKSAAAASSANKTRLQRVDGLVTPQEESNTTSTNAPTRLTKTKHSARSVDISSSVPTMSNRTRTTRRNTTSIRKTPPSSWAKRTTAKTIIRDTSSLALASTPAKRYYSLIPIKRSQLNRRLTPSSKTRPASQPIASKNNSNAASISRSRHSISQSLASPHITPSAGSSATPRLSGASSAASSAYSSSVEQHFCDLEMVRQLVLKNKTNTHTHTYTQNKQTNKQTNNTCRLPFQAVELHVRKQPPHSQAPHWSNGAQRPPPVVPAPMEGLIMKPLPQNHRLLSGSVEL